MRVRRHRSLPRRRQRTFLAEAACIASQHLRSGQPAVIQALSSSTRQRVLPPSFVGLGTLAAACSRRRRSRSWARSRAAAASARASPSPITSSSGIPLARGPEGRVAVADIEHLRGVGWFASRSNYPPFQLHFTSPLVGNTGRIL